MGFVKMTSGLKRPAMPGLKFVPFPPQKGGKSVQFHWQSLKVRHLEPPLYIATGGEPSQARLQLAGAAVSVMYLSVV